MKHLVFDRNSILDNVIKKINITTDLGQADSVVLWSDVPYDLYKYTVQARFHRKHTIVFQHGREATVDYTPEGVNPLGNNFGLAGDYYFCWGDRDYRRMSEKFGKKRIIQTGNPAFDDCVGRDKEADRDFLLKEYGIPKNKTLIVHAPMHYFVHNERSEEVSKELDRVCKKNGWVLATSICKDEPMGDKYQGIHCSNSRTDDTGRHIRTVHALTNCADLVVDEAVVTFSLYALAYGTKDIQIYMGDISKNFPKANNIKVVDKPCDFADVVKDLSTLEDVIKDNLENDKYVEERKKELAETAGKIDGQSTKRFVDAIYKVCEKKIPLYACEKAGQELNDSIRLGSRR